MYLQYNKIANIKIALQHVDKLTLFPGDTFSYWKAIGKPTKRKGYLKGMTLHNGTFKPGTGALEFSFEEPWWKNQTKGTATLNLVDDGKRLKEIGRAHV